MSFILFFTLILFSFNSIEQDDDWSKKEKEKFLSNCISNAKSQVGDVAEPYCNCMLEKVIKIYPDPKTKSPEMDKILELGSACLKEILEKAEK